MRRRTGLADIHRDENRGPGKHGPDDHAGGGERIDAGSSIGKPRRVGGRRDKIQEKQRVLGVFPNFYVSYDPDAAPCSARSKSSSWRGGPRSIRTTTSVLTGATAGVQQWQNNFSGYGQGAQGYAKRYGAIYAGTVTGTFLGGAVFPSLFKQDPRYFYKGTGTVRSRFLYAIANAVICKGDNRKWQPAYSSILGDLASGEFRTRIIRRAIAGRRWCLRIR